MPNKVSKNLRQNSSWQKMAEENSVFTGSLAVIICCFGFATNRFLAAFAPHSISIYQMADQRNKLNFENFSRKFSIGQFVIERGFKNFDRNLDQNKEIPIFSIRSVQAIDLHM